MDTDRKLMLGIDEAGMGPVFGPLVVSGVVVDSEYLGHLKDCGVKDSKKFGSGLNAHRKRQKVWEDAVPYVIREKQVIIEAEELDRVNMYDLHIEATREILIALRWPEVEEVYIEQIGSLGREKFLNRIGFRHSGFIYEKKADVNYPVVSLASIKAKIVRDIAVQKLCGDLNEDYISGYANYQTELFLRRYYDKTGCLPPGTRVSRKWDPILEMLG